HENNDETGSQRRPHHLALPGGRVVLHLSTASKCRSGVRQLQFTWTSAGLGCSVVRCSMFDANLLVRSDWLFPVNSCRSSFWWFGSCPRDSCFSDRAPAPFARLPMLPGSDSTSNRCRRCAQTPRDPRALRFSQRAAGRPKPDRTDPSEIPPSRDCPDTTHYLVRFPGRV